MPKDHLPVYAIVELLIRLSANYPTIGNYKNHSVADDAVVVKTSSGTINFPVQLVMEQFHHPEAITDETLSIAASTFKNSR